MNGNEVSRLLLKVLSWSKCKLVGFFKDFVEKKVSTYNDFTFGSQSHRATGMNRTSHRSTVKCSKLARFFRFGNVPRCLIDERVLIAESFWINLNYYHSNQI